MLQSVAFLPFWHLPVVSSKAVGVCPIRMHLTDIFLPHNLHGVLSYTFQKHMDLTS